MGRKKSYNNASIMTLRLKQNHALDKDAEFNELHAMYLELSPALQCDIEQMELAFEKGVPGMGPKSALELAMKLFMWVAVHPCPTSSPSQKRLNSVCSRTHRGDQ